MSCDHNDPKVWKEEADPKRKGWVRTVCKVCGKFIGYRQVKES